MNPYERQFEECDVPAVTKHPTPNVSPNARTVEQDFVVQFMTHIASASDVELGPAVIDALSRISVFWGASRAFLFRRMGGEIAAHVYEWPTRLDKRADGLLTDWMAARQARPRPQEVEHDWWATSVKRDGQPDFAHGTRFGTDQDGGILILYVPVSDAMALGKHVALPKPIFDGLLALLQRGDKKAAHDASDEIRVGGATTARDQLLGAIEAMEDGVVLYDAENRLTTYNPRFCDFYTIPAGALAPGTPYAEVRRLVAAFGSVMDADGQPEDLSKRQSGDAPPRIQSFERILSDGRTLRVTERLLPAGDRIEIHSDITRLKVAEQRLRNVVDGARICTWEWNVKTGEHKVNEYWAKLLGYRLEELSPVTFNTWRSRVHPEDLPATQALFEKSVSNDDVIYLAEYRMRHRNGNWIWVLDSGRTLHRGPGGTPELIAGVQVEITEQRAREAALAAVKADLERSIVERATVEQRLVDIATVSDGWLWEMDKNCRYSLVMDGEYFDDGGVPPEGLIGKTHEEWLAANPDMLVGIEWDDLVAAINGHKPFRDFIYRAPKSTDGVVRWRRLTGKPIFDASGTFTGYRGVGSDVT
ncbi:MAG: PAS domain-containing protein, partial [Paracoccaceae bacterium]